MAKYLVNDIELNVKIEGKGPPLIFLHGLGSNLRVWNREVSYFHPYFTTVRLDLRGHGESAKPSKYNLQDHVQDVVGLMDELGLNNAIVVGASMGSYVAQGIATQIPDRIRGLVLIVPKCHGMNSSSSRILAQHAKQLSAMTHDERQEYLLGLAFGPYATAECKQSWIEQERSHPLSDEEWTAASQALAGFDFRAALPRVTANTLVMSGRHDILNSVLDGQECASLIPHAQFVEMKRSGHFPNVEEPRLYLTVLAEFLSGW